MVLTQDFRGEEVEQNKHISEIAEISDIVKIAKINSK